MSLRARRGNQENRDGEFKSMALTVTMANVCVRVRNRQQREVDLMKKKGIS